jgi:enhancing lycopene biosynthesis protein 2
MAKRVGVILSGLGRRDGTDVAEALLSLLIIDRAGAEAVCAAPDIDQPLLVDHARDQVVAGAPPRNARTEAARLVPGPVVPLATLDPRTLDALLVPGGEGAGTMLSDYTTKGQLCQVHPDISRLLRALLPSRRPMGFIGLSAVLAARVLGPVAGVRLTLGARGTSESKHAAVMGADVRPSTVDDLIVDEKARVFSTPGFLAEGARLAQVARAIDKLVRGVLAVSRDRAPSAGPKPEQKSGQPKAGQPKAGAPPATGRARGSA